MSSISRVSFAGLAALLLATTAVSAADWAKPQQDLRWGYENEPKDWSGVGDPQDELNFEFGLRYWYSMGSQKFEGQVGTAGLDSTGHTAELHLRIDDVSSRSYAKGLAGYSIAVTGNYDGPYGSGSVVDGTISYLGGDFGWNVFGDQQGSGIGLLAGYLYWNDSPRTSRGDFVTATSASDLTVDASGLIAMPWDSSETWLETQSLRLGLSGRAKLGDMFDVSAELAAVPVAKVQGVIAGWESSGETALGNPAFVKTSETSVDGWGYGAMGEVMLGITPVENLTLRLGGRAWYLQGTYDATYTAAQITDPVDTEPDGVYNGSSDLPPGFYNQGYIETKSPFSLLRYGLVAELTYAF